MTAECWVFFFDPVFCFCHLRVLHSQKMADKANFGIKTMLKCYQRLTWRSSVCTMLVFLCVSQCQKCNSAVGAEVSPPFCDSSNCWLQKAKASLVSIRPTLLALGRILDHTRSPLAQESPASMSLSPPSPHPPASHLFCPPPQSAGFCNSCSPVHGLHCMAGPRCLGTLPAPPRHWSDGGCLVPEWGDTAHCSPCNRHLSGTRYDGAIRSGTELLEAQIEEGWGKRSGRHPTCHKSGHSPSHREPV